MDYLFSADASLFALFIASFLSATILPGGSEVVLFAAVRLHPDQTFAALALATIGNTLGGMSTYFLARLLSQRELSMRLSALKRYGVAALFFSWTPVIGDALCAAAGWLRLNWLYSMLWMAVGKFCRYLVFVAGIGML